MTKREQAAKERQRRDLEEAQRAFTLLSASEQRQIVDALHAEAMARLADEAHWRWAHLLEQLDGDALAAKRLLDSFAAEILGCNPGYALRGSDRAFEMAARFDVYTEFAQALRSHGPAKVATHFAHTLISRASSPHHSTSRTSSLYEEYYTASIARALEALRWAGYGF